MKKSPSCSHSNVCILSFLTASCQHWPLLLEFSAFCFLKPVLCQLWKTSTKYWMWLQRKPLKRVTYSRGKTRRNLWYMDFMNATVKWKTEVSRLIDVVNVLRQTPSDRKRFRLCFLYERFCFGISYIWTNWTPVFIKFIWRVTDAKIYVSVFQKI